jgi:deoxyribose-phosphate aldolase
VTSAGALAEGLRAQLVAAGLFPAGELRRASDAAALAERCATDPRALAAVLDSTLLAPEATGAQVAALCDEAQRLGCATVCVNPLWVADCAARLEGPVRVGTVVGFPLGANDPAVKADEAALAVAAGAHEVDMVLAIGLLRDAAPEGGALDVRRLAAVLEDVRGVVLAVREAEGPADLGARRVKVILETCLLDERQKVLGALLAVAADAHWVKTSTGFSRGGATVEDVALLRACTMGSAGVKASGGIRDRAAALDMLRAGADRIGTSRAAAVVAG